MNLKFNSNSRIASRNLYLDRMSEEYLVNEIDGIYLGRSSIYKLPVLLDLDGLMNKNIAVLGMSGSGKSYFLKSFIIRSNLQRNSSVLIVDWNNEYNEIISYLGGKTLRLGLNFRINIFDLYDMRNIRNIKEVSDIISYSISLDSEESYTIYNMILSLRFEKEASKINLTGLIARLKKDRGEKSKRLRNKLIQLNENPMFADKTDVPVQTLLSGVVSIDFSMLRDNTQRNEISKSIFRIIIELMHSTAINSTAKGTEKLVILDEAWRLIKNSEDVGVMFREGRKYGFCVAVATQMVSDINNEVLSNSACLFLFRLQNESDYRLLIDSGIIKEIDAHKMMQLPVGGCMVSMALTNNNGRISKFFIESIDGIPTGSFKIIGEKMQRNISYRLFTNATKNLMVSEEQRERLIDFLAENNNEVECSQLIKFMIGLKIERWEIIHYLRSLGLKDVEIIGAYDRNFSFVR